MSSVFEIIRAYLDPNEIRKYLNIYYEERERFLPRVIITDSYDEMIAELARFYMVAQDRWFTSPGVWTIERARGAVIEILNMRLGEKGMPKSGEYRAMRYASTGDRGGVAFLLDAVTDVLVFQALKQYVDFRVMPLMSGLVAEEMMALAKAYADELAGPMGRTTDSPASLALRMKSIIMDHALAAFWGDATRVP